MNVRVMQLQQALRAEMIKQNNKSSLERSYHEADRIVEQIRELETKSTTKIRFDENWRR